MATYPSPRFFAGGVYGWVIASYVGKGLDTYFVGLKERHFVLQGRRLLENFGGLDGRFVHLTEMRSTKTLSPTS